MNTHSDGPRDGDKPATPHTEEHATADGATGDTAPEVEENMPPRRRTLDDAADATDRTEAADRTEGDDGPAGR